MANATSVKPSYMYNVHHKPVFPGATHFVDLNFCDQS